MPSQFSLIPFTFVENMIIRRFFIPIILTLLLLPFGAYSLDLDSLKTARQNVLPGSQEELLIVKDMMRYYIHQEQNDSAILYGLEAENLARQLKNAEELADVYTYLGIMYQYRGRYQKANDYSFKALSIKDSLQLGPISLAESHGNLAVCFQELKQFDKAIEHSLLALDYFKEGGDSNRAAMRFYQIGGLLYEFGLYDSAKVYYDLALDWYTALGHESYIAIYPTYVGLIYLKQNKLRAAEAEFLKSLNSYPPDGRQRFKVFIYVNLAVVNLVMGAERDSIGRRELYRAIEYAKQSYSLAEELDFLHQMRKANEVFYKAYDALGESEQAIHYAKAFIDLNDSLYNIEQQKVITELQTKYESGKQEAQIEFLSQTNQQQEELARTQELIIYILSGAGLLIISFGMNSYRLYRQKNRSLQELEKSNAVISQQNEEREILLKEIHHRVKNNLQVISSLLDLQSSAISDPKALIAVEDGQSRVKAMALIHQKLYQNEDLSLIDIKDFILKLIEQNGAMQEKQAQCEYDLPEGQLMMDIDTAVPLGLILNELVTNAYKYGQDNEGELHLIIRLIPRDDHYYLEFCDGGNGLPEGMDWEKSRSLGLRLIKRLSRQLYGRVAYEYRDGACFKIEFKNTDQRREIA
ncbi:histidine kinase dimerization/phosphoacceptor domain -containing protein [Croceimicrobium hydrocarbonivorans]|uniref:histidine kinase n=1 Tax=Croceimicrobium hydrocarbonivorans TaxID=2761580 RepID=A0A7H0VFR5_9FLAO|nr:histidine kinase dimerization/phosphoacceptor domain -containing protein [Croceimicrobium hydrocarbonivorans]QNR24563.1 tetratricopeptide repeat protein [Croceimicrobium hydrocarbonivorans]